MIAEVLVSVIFGIFVLFALLSLYRAVFPRIVFIIEKRGDYYSVMQKNVIYEGVNINIPTISSLMFTDFSYFYVYSNGKIDSTFGRYSATGFKTIEDAEKAIETFKSQSE